MSLGDDGSELAVKHDRVRAILQERGAASVLLESHAAVAWLLGGARVHVSLAAPPIVAVRVDAASVTVFATSNEAHRLRAEELPAGVALVERDWFEAVSFAPATEGSDAALREHEVEVELRAARRALLPVEQQRYRELGADAAVALGDVLRAARPADTERSVAARLAARLIEVGADPVVLLVAGASRLAERHPLPTDAAIGRRAMAVVCARRHGLIANVTRWVRFGAASPSELDAERRILEVEADGFDALRRRTGLADVLNAVTAAYPAHGFATDEWLRHHQGGAAGYHGRDPRLAPGVDGSIELGQAFALNPSAPGVKVEDTVLLAPDAAGGVAIEVLTCDPAWPTIAVRGVERPVTLER
ncbi:M24 family metallopeptidase [Leifsonia sp. Leaf264]|uniref:M24 family metallopeptidase n=1 Tax=Leifsonia sp. Leaf264 TaxID=1736314 RepID=UPI0006F54D40|nr:M24 family metallopeptidase [Leifsonia sp. Leaf264]KQO97048.1 hypothetical protein ASF30_18555 [Leifsonia sp. Leaf264]